MQRDFDVLYTSFEPDGAIDEVYSLFSLQPVFPSKEHWFAHKLQVGAKKILKLTDFSALTKLGSKRFATWLVSTA